MKIIKEGNPKWWVGLQSKCLYCGTVFELDELDMVVAKTSIIDSSLLVTLDCLRCKYPVIFYKPKEPSKT